MKNQNRVGEKNNRKSQRTQVRPARNVQIKLEMDAVTARKIELVCRWNHADPKKYLLSLIEAMLVAEIGDMSSAISEAPQDSWAFGLRFGSKTSRQRERKWANKFWPQLLPLLNKEERENTHLDKGEL